MLAREPPGDPRIQTQIPFCRKQGIIGVLRNAKSEFQSGIRESANLLRRGSEACQASEFKNDAASCASAEREPVLFGVALRAANASFQFEGDYFEPCSIKKARLMPLTDGARCRGKKASTRRSGCRS